MCLSACRQVPRQIHDTLSPQSQMSLEIEWGQARRHNAGSKDCCLPNVHHMSGVVLELGRCDSFTVLSLLQGKCIKTGITVIDRAMEIIKHI